MAKVLVVDDVADNVVLLTYELADHGFEVVTAFNGRQALDVAKTERPDVILLDIMMPGMDGFQVCRKLKENHELRSIPVIMVSAREQEDDVVKGLDAGAHDYVTKPFKLPVVLARVRSAVRAKADHDLIVSMNEQLAEHAAMDALTGLRNRGRFREALYNLHRESLLRKLPLSLIMIDVDWFKNYNDAFGHPAGDGVLCTVANLIQKSAPDPGLAARYGGEEFTVLLPLTGSEAGKSLAERLRQSILNYPWPLRRISASLGIATSRPGMIDPSRLVEEADRALYHAKQSGRNAAVHYHELTAVEAGFAHTISSEAREAFARSDH
jgi:diguanylate cyclase (GGDEF)-like protein